MKKMIYKLEYKDFIGRKRIKEYREVCIVNVMNDAKKFVQINRISIAKVVTPSGKIYYV